MEKNPMSADEEERINDAITAKIIDEITGGEMKKVGAQKMENELTIKKLDREYLEIKRNLIYSKKMLDEARKNGTTQTETKNQLLHANKAIIEKFNELKRYQNEITLLNISKGEKSIQDCVDRNNECARILHIILDKDNYFDFLKKNLLDKQNQLNDDIQRQIEQKRESLSNREETLLHLTKKLESQKVEIEGEKLDNRIRYAVEERNKRIIQLQADIEALCKQFKQEIDDLQQKKLDKIQNLENHKNNVKNSENRLCNLQSQLTEIEKNLTIQIKNLENVKAKNNDVSDEIQKKREANSQSNESIENTITSLHDELAVVDSELQKEQNTFNEIENEMQNGMKKLFTELEEKKKWQNTLENRQRDLSKLKEKRIEQQKLLSQKGELDNKLADLTDEYKKQLSIGSINTNKQIELNAKIKDLREKRDNSRKQLENLSKMQANRTNRATSYSNDSDAKSSADNVMPSQQVNSQRKSYDFGRTSRETEKNVATPKKSSLYSDILEQSRTFNLDSSDESSEDDFKVFNKTSRKPPPPTTTPIHKKHDYTCGFEDKNNEKPASETLSQSERLFDKLMGTQKSTESSTNKKDDDVFKIPATYASCKKRSATTKKY